ncbi:hypothetical protein ScPMuIL_017288 [Solemya velum]
MVFTGCLLVDIPRGLAEKLSAPSEQVKQNLRAEHDDAILCIHYIPGYFVVCLKYDYGYVDATKNGITGRFCFTTQYIVKKYKVAVRHVCSDVHFILQIQEKLKDIFKIDFLI